MVASREGWGEGIVMEFGIDMYTLLYIKWITNTESLRTLLNVMWQPGWEGSWGTCVYIEFRVYVWLSHSARHLKLSQHC